MNKINVCKPLKIKGELKGEGNTNSLKASKKEENAENKELFEKLDDFQDVWAMTTDYKILGVNNEELEEFSDRLINNFIEGFKKFVSENEVKNE